MLAPSGYVRSPPGTLAHSQSPPTGAENTTTSEDSDDSTPHSALVSPSCDPYPPTPYTLHHGVPNQGRLCKTFSIATFWKKSKLFNNQLGSSVCLSVWVEFFELLLELVSLKYCTHIRISDSDGTIIPGINREKKIYFKL